MNKLIAIAIASLFAANVALAADAAKPAAAAAPAATAAKPAAATPAVKPAEAPKAAPAEAAKPAAASGCEAKAVSKDGKPLAGAAKAASIKKCEKSNPAAADGKTTQQNKMKTCNVDAKGKKGDERKAFMKECLSK